MAKAPHPYSMPALAASLATATQPNDRANAVAWLEGLNIPMIDVSFLRSDGSWFVETHVDDPSTIFDTIGMALGRSGNRYAVVLHGGSWVLYSHKHGARYYDTKEAAEMVAIHNG